ncbi:MAG: diaminopimelate epimerase [Planctomycetota bacterium]
MPFIKMHGAGNDYVYIDTFDGKSIDDPHTLARQMSHRRFGVGGDGLILIHPSEVADARMQMHNADGSESEMCGNGIRCVAKYLYDEGLVHKPELRIETGAGVLTLRLEPDASDRVKQVTVNMGRPRLSAAEIPTTVLSNDDRVIDVPVEFDGKTYAVTCVSMGNPHCVLFVPEASDALVLGLGPRIETDPRFPKRTNVEFVEVISRGEVRQRTWERGSGETWACGTGASAVCVAGVLTGRTEDRILNHLVGGDLRLHYDGEVVWMTGGAVTTFRGSWSMPNATAT